MNEMSRRAAQVLIATAMMAQVSCESDGRIVGVVRNNFGSPVQGAVVAIRGSEFSATTDSGGKFSLGFVPGEFVLTVAATSHAPHEIPLKLFSKARYPLASVTLALLPPSDGFRVAAEAEYVLVKATTLSSRKRRTGQFMPPCTDLLPGSPPVVSGPTFVAFTPSAPAQNWTLVRPTSNGIPGMPGGLAGESDCGGMQELKVKWTTVGRGQMITGDVADGVVCLARKQSLGGLMRYIEPQAACVNWKTVKAAPRP
jgi:hypothetical protein